jgi:hypothetical protein
MFAEPRFFNRQVELLEEFFFGLAPPGAPALGERFEVLSVIVLQKTNCVQGAARLYRVHMRLDSDFRICYRLGRTGNWPNENFHLANSRHYNPRCVRAKRGGRWLG